MGIRVEIDIEYGDSPVLDGEWVAITDDMFDESEDILARTGAEYVRDFADSHIRQNRGHYISRIRHEQHGGRWEITDQRSDYGPWLAGTSARNKRNKFKGYKHWDEARELLDRDKVKIVAPVLRGYRRRLQR
jgi:hypothetical protein